MEVLRGPTDVDELIGAPWPASDPGPTVSPPASTRRTPRQTDPVLLERVVANLVDNALLHGAGRPVRVEAGRWPAGSTSGWSTTGPGSGPTTTGSSSRSSDWATPTTGPAWASAGGVSGFHRSGRRRARPRGHPGRRLHLVIRLPVPDEPTLTIIDADLDEDVDGGDDESRPGPTATRTADVDPGAPPAGPGRPHRPGLR